MHAYIRKGEAEERGNFPLAIRNFKNRILTQEMGEYLKYSHCGDPDVLRLRQSCACQPARLMLFGPKWQGETSIAIYPYSSFPDEISVRQKKKKSIQTFQTLAFFLPPPASAFHILPFYPPICLIFAPVLKLPLSELKPLVPPSLSLLWVCLLSDCYPYKLDPPLLCCLRVCMASPLFSSALRSIPCLNTDFGPRERRF